MIKKLIHALCGILLVASMVPSTQASGSTNQSSGTLPAWVGGSTHNWKPRLGGVYWLNSRAIVKQAAPYFSQSSRPILVDIKSDGTGFGYRFDLNTWDSQSAIHTYYPWDGSDAGTAATAEDVMNILGATGNAEFILNIPIPLNLTNTPSSNWGYDGFGYTWQTPQFYAAMVQYLFGTAGPQSEWQSLPVNLDFFSQPASFNWADLRARRGHVNPYPVVAVIIGEEPYNLEGTPTGALYGPQAEKFRAAIRSRGSNVALGLHVRDMGIVDDSGGAWFYPMANSLNMSDFSFIDLDHYYQFSAVPEDFKRTFPVSVNSKGFQGWWLSQSTWKSDYSKFLWIVQDTRNAIRDDSAVAGLGDPTRWQMGFSEHGIQIVSQFVYNDMFSAMHWGGWLAESMRQNVTWDSGWGLLAEGWSTAALQSVNGYMTRTPMFYVYQMAQDFYGYDYLTNSYTSAFGSTADGQGNPIQYPYTTVRTFRDPASGNIHLFVVNQSTNTAVTITGFENWNVTGWKQLSAASLASSNPLGVAGPEPIQTVSAALPAVGQSLTIPPISVNHIILSTSGATNVADTTPPTVSVTSPLNGSTVSGTGVLIAAAASDNVGLASVQIQLDGANLGSPFTVAPFSVLLDSTTISAGSHTVTAIATDLSGNQATATAVTILVSNVVSIPTLPTISVVATSATATIGTTNDAIVTFSRTGATTLPQTVNFSLGGTAVKWTDYRRPEGDMPVSIIIPAGASSYSMSIQAVMNSTGVNPLTATFSLAADPTYAVGSPATASIKLVVNSISIKSIRPTGTSIAIAWTSTASKVYRVAYKDSITAPAWTDISGDITATDVSTTWTDTTANRMTQRYYQVYSTN